MSASPLRFLIIHSQHVIADLWAYWLQHQFPDCHLERNATPSAAFDRKGEPIADICIFDAGSAKDDWGEFIEESFHRAVARKMLVLTTDDDDYLLAMLRIARLDGIVDLNEEGLSGMLEAIRALAANGSYISPRFGQVLFKHTMQANSSLGNLTDAQTRVLASIGAGYTNVEIAVEQRISPSTVQCHMRNIMRKLGVRRAGELVTQAFRLGVVKASSHGVHRPGFEMSLSARNLRRAVRNAKTQKKISGA